MSRLLNPLSALLRLGGYAALAACHWHDMAAGGYLSILAGMILPSLRRRTQEK